MVDVQTTPRGGLGVVTTPRFEFQQYPTHFFAFTPVTPGPLPMLTPPSMNGVPTTPTAVLTPVLVGHPQLQPAAVEAHNRVQSQTRGEAVVTQGGPALQQDATAHGHAKAIATGQKPATSSVAAKSFVNELSASRAKRDGEAASIERWMEQYHGLGQKAKDSSPDDKSTPEPADTSNKPTLHVAVPVEQTTPGFAPQLCPVQSPAVSLKGEFNWGSAPSIFLTPSRPGTPNSTMTPTRLIPQMIAPLLQSNRSQYPVGQTFLISPRYVPTTSSTTHTTDGAMSHQSPPQPPLILAEASHPATHQVTANGHGHSHGQYPKPPMAYAANPAMASYGHPGNAHAHAHAHAHGHPHAHAHAGMQQLQTRAPSAMTLSNPPEVIVEGVEPSGYSASSDQSDPESDGTTSSSSRTASRSSGAQLDYAVPSNQHPPRFKPRRGLNPASEAFVSGQVESRVCKHWLRGYCMRSNDCKFLHQSYTHTNVQQGPAPPQHQHQHQHQHQQDVYTTTTTGVAGPTYSRMTTANGYITASQMSLTATVLNPSGNIYRGTEPRKKKLCRHFMKGYCKQGDSCSFLHDPSIFCSDDQKIFLGGLPAHITTAVLVQELGRQGYKVINQPKVLRGFTPQVCLETPEQASSLVAKKKITIAGAPVDVRAYEDKKPLDDVRRSVFLGGLPASTTVEQIVADLAKDGCEVKNLPVLKNGFTPQVILATVEQAQSLIRRKKVVVANKSVDVRPYVDFRRRY